MNYLKNFRDNLIIALKTKANEGHWLWTRFFLLEPIQRKAALWFAFIITVAVITTVWNWIGGLLG